MTTLKIKSGILIRIIFALLLFVSCDDDDSGAVNNFDPGSPATGRGGSTARFAISGDHLYTVDNASLNVFSIENPSSPAFMSKQSIGRNIETIFPRGNNLFIGSQGGVFIYSIENPAVPQFLSEFRHVVACDPVVANETHAFVTLRSIDNFCGRFTNQLDVLDINDLTNPILVREYAMENPQGLDILGNQLFICDNGLKVFDATDVENIFQIAKYEIPANDVIALSSHLIVTSDIGIYQYAYGDSTLSQLSLIAKGN